MALVMLAAACNAVMDNISHHWHKSIFNTSSYNVLFWNPSTSWLNKYVDRDYNKGLRRGLFVTTFSDAWHIFKSLMIIFLITAIVVFKYDEAFVDSKWYSYFIAIGMLGIIWNFTFYIFYHKVLNK